MLDVDPPEAAARSWRDFAIQIATIVCGLLIAVSLEQTVEWFHHRHQVAETREALQQERALNARISVVLLEEYRRITPKLQGDMAAFRYLRDHPGAPKADWPAEITWNSLSIKYLNSAWKTAQEGSTLALMPPREVERWSELYARLDDGEKSYVEFIDAIERARRYSYTNPDPSSLSPSEIEDELGRVADLLAAHVRRGRTLATLTLRFREFAGPSSDEIIQLNPNFTNAGDRAATEVLAKRIRDIKDEQRSARQ